MFFKKKNSTGKRVKSTSPFFFGNTFHPPFIAGSKKMHGSRHSIHSHPPKQDDWFGGTWSLQLSPTISRWAQTKIIHSLVGTEPSSNHPAGLFSRSKCKKKTSRHLSPVFHRKRLTQTNLTHFLASISVKNNLNDTGFPQKIYLIQWRDCTKKGRKKRDATGFKPHGPRGRFWAEILGWLFGDFSICGPWDLVAFGFSRPQHPKTLAPKRRFFPLRRVWATAQGKTGIQFRWSSKT